MRITGLIWALMLLVPGTPLLALPQGLPPGGLTLEPEGGPALYLVLHEQRWRLYALPEDDEDEAGPQPLPYARVTVRGALASDPDDAFFLALEPEAQEAYWSHPRHFYIPYDFRLTLVLEATGAEVEVLPGLRYRQSPPPAPAAAP